MMIGWQIAIAWAFEKGDIDNEHDVPRCWHCNAYPRIDMDGDDDRRCIACNKSHRECYLCDDLGAETCIECDRDFCQACWPTSEHAEIHRCMSFRRYG